MNKRRYAQKKRASQQAQTRERIVRATMALHEELGPRDTSVSAIAERAGVQRLTVYRHFPDDAALFQACTTRWLELNPPPDPAQWQALEDPMARLHRALIRFYAYYRQGERMWSLAHRDRREVAALQAPMAAFDTLLMEIRDDLARGWRLNKASKAGLVATLDLALRFQTWQSLQTAGIGDTAMADLVCGWLACLSRERLNV